MSLNEISNDKLRRRVERIQQILNRNTKKNHLTMLACSVIGGLFLPLQFTYATILYTGLESLYYFNASFTMHKGDRILFDSTKYESLIKLYINGVQMMTVVSPIVWYSRYRAASTAIVEVTSQMPPAPPPIPPTV